MKETIRVFRRFNRFHTRFLGLLSQRLLNSPLTLAQARVLFEINALPGASASELADLLAMDRGQMSRVLNALLKKGLVERSGEPGGRRSLPLSPTSRGKTELEAIEKRADAQAAELLKGLDQKQRGRLRAALNEAEALLKGEPRTKGNDEPVLREAVSGDLGWIITSHARLYGELSGFNREFEEYVLLGLGEYLQAGRDKGGVWIAEHDGEAVGSVGVVERPDNSAQLRWLLVEPRAQGLGLGRLLVEKAVRICRERGYGRIVLWTLQELLPARALYKSLGFALIEEKQGVMGGRSLTEECWVLRLGQTCACE